MDHSAKIFDLARTDALLAFAGDTHYAYPLALQMQAAVKLYPRSADRRYPLSNARGHMIRVFNQVYGAIHGLPVGRDRPVEDEPPVQFLFAGYSWHVNDFLIWYISLNRERREFVFRQGGRMMFIGNRDAVQTARGRTMRLLAQRGRNTDSIDMEPFEVLRDIIRANEHAYVGGVPQIAKVYRHMNTQFFSTIWRTEQGRQAHVFGRPLLGPESLAWPLFDPDTFEFTARLPTANGADDIDGEA